MTQRQPRPERSGWRDERISRRHRSWGVWYPAVDIDFLLVEYKRGLPKALIEYKHQYARTPNLNDSTYKALAALANSAQIPLFLVRYHRDFEWFRITPVNPRSFEFVPKTIQISEEKYKQFLFDIRIGTSPVRAVE